ncbi:MAG: site-specific DNA-methyltransferase [Sulfuricurvum sp.]|uniref:DNA methyltransferase n=1 Tax=Sulfuricurvum sp. TaxID=2025608 RepID=UPI002621B630|nr:site-specific DNA-methyltransferase [Sulfuricurvum sp.]MDD5160036.1 site-specific DNA-methyltransferase [Sulfuricurvum sp.]
MVNIQQKFKDFILDDIFWFNKSELNFGIYKIFRQKEEFIKQNLDTIVTNIEKELSNSNENNVEKLKVRLLEYIPPKIAKDLPLDTIEDLESAINNFGNGDTQNLLDELKACKSEEKYDSTKVYEYLYQFFNLYYEKGDFGYTPRSFKTYTIPYKYEAYLSESKDEKADGGSQDVDYRGEETLFTWKTKDSYYIKSNKFLNSVSLNLSYKDKNYTINTNIIEKDDDIKDDKKVKQYRLISIKKDNNTITLNFNISDHATPKYTIYLLMLSVINLDMDTFDYDTVFKDNKLKAYFEKLPFKDEKIQTSLLDVNQLKASEEFKTLMEDQELFEYLFIKSKKDGKEVVSSLFKYELGGEEDKTQLKIKASKLMISKKEYATKVHNKTSVKNFGFDKFDFEDKKQLEELFDKDADLSFFYRLDRGINLFYSGVDSDYFIHKNLKRFLSVELDKFIKNYIFADTDAILLMDESAKRIAIFARVFKAQAKIFIDLLSSIEEFQKYLWEKRKMVKESHYVISSNQIKDISLLNEVLNNTDQLQEWETLGITKINVKPDLLELQRKSYPIDTKYFNVKDITFKYRVLSQFENIEEELSGLLIKSENYQALKLLEPKYTNIKGDGKIKCVYIDPPYNTGNDGFIYKDSFKSSSWLSMMTDRLEIAKKMISEDGSLFSQIDYKEFDSLKKILDIEFTKENFVQSISVKTSSPAGIKTFNPGPIDVTEYIYFYAKNKKAFEFSKVFIPSSYDSNYNLVISNPAEESEKWIIKPLNDVIYTTLGVEVGKTPQQSNNNAKEKLGNYWMLIREEEKAKYCLKNAKNIVSIRDPQKPTEKLKNLLLESKNETTKVYTYLKDNGEKSFIFKGGVLSFYSNKVKTLHGKNTSTEILTDFWADISWDGIAKEGAVELKNGKKPEKLIDRICQVSGIKSGEIILDFFGGSGTTAAVGYKLNKKFISVEMNDYFETKMLRRLKYTMYGNSGGIDSQKISGIFQYIELEQYDDIIDRLQVVKDIDYSKIDSGYIYEPDKNQINFRMNNELNNPLSSENKFDIFSSLLFHEGLDLIKIFLEDEILFAECKDKYEKYCAIVLSNNEEKAKKKVKDISEGYSKVYSNFLTHGAEHIIAETFKGK